MSKIFKIGITGGPGGGKSRLLHKLAEKVELRGYKVITVEEAAMKLITNGIVPGDNISLEDFQTFVLDEQLHNEKLAWSAAEMFGDDYVGVVILCDRGLADQIAYVGRDKFQSLLKKRSMTLSDVYKTYNGVIHLLTAADGAEEFYEWAGAENSDRVNKFRPETPEQAREKDRLTQGAWIGSSHFRVVDNSTDFDGKLLRAVSEVFVILGEPVPTEIERKFIVQKPSAEQINGLGCVSRSTIVQTYLVEKEKGVERRVRQRGSEKEGYRFYYTEKRAVGYGERRENENLIDVDRYITLLSESDTSLHQITKERFCFLYERRQFELDIYPFSDQYAVLEIEVNDINENIQLPPSIEILKDVTGDSRYKNHELAKTLDLGFENL